MAAFSYEALNPSGKIIKGVMEADSDRQVRSQLRQQQLKPLAVKSVRQRQTGQQAVSGRHWQRSISHRDLAVVTRQLASLVKSGLPLEEALQATIRQSRKPHIKAVLLQVRSKVLEGLSLAQALAQSPRSFDAMYRALVRAGESSGHLGVVLERLAEYTEASQYSRQRLRMAMIYPLVLLLVSLSVVAVLMTFVVPKLVTIFTHSERDLPWLTQALIAISDFGVSYGLLTLVLLMVAGIGLRFWLQAPGRQRVWHRLLLRLPVVGYLVTQADSTRFAATLSLLVGSGVSLVDALRIASEVFANRVLREESQQLVTAVSEGSGLARAMDQAGFFPPLFVQMAASGEMNGELGKQLEHAAIQQQRELDVLLGTLTGILEPLTVIVMGVIVTVIVLAILLPIFDLNSLV